MTHYGQWEEWRDCLELLIVCEFYNFWSWLACTTDFKKVICQFFRRGELCSFASGEQGDMRTRKRLKNLILLPLNSFTVNSMKARLSLKYKLSVPFPSTVIALTTPFLTMVKESSGSRVVNRKHCQMFSITMM